MSIPGFEFSTFSIVARCDRTGMLGVGIATHGYAVGARCPHVRAGIGAVATQATTDPRLGQLALRLLEQGHSAGEALARVAAGDPHVEYRQIGIVDRHRNGAARTGSMNRGWAGHVADRDFVVMGNGLAGARVIESMAEAFLATVESELEERLLRAIEAGRDAGGQPQGQLSSALVVHNREPFPWVDLRVDAHEEPVGELRRILELFRPLKEHLTLRASDPHRPEPEVP